MNRSEMTLEQLIDHAAVVVEKLRTLEESQSSASTMHFEAGELRETATLLIARLEVHMQD